MRDPWPNRKTVLNYSKFPRTHWITLTHSFSRTKCERKRLGMPQRETQHTEFSCSQFVTDARHKIYVTAQIFISNVIVMHKDKDIYVREMASGSEWTGATLFECECTFWICHWLSRFMYGEMGIFGKEVKEGESVHECLVATFPYLCLSSAPVSHALAHFGRATWTHSTINRNISSATLI